MKKLILISLFLFWKTLLYGCDYCNCYMDLNPQYKSNLIGVRYSSMYSEGSYKMGDDISHSELNMKMYEDDFELYGQVFPIDKLQIYFTIPYKITKQEINVKTSETFVNSHHGEEHTFIYNHTESSDQIYSGIGDPVIIFHYQLLNNISLDSNKYNFRILAGAGVKFPLGNTTLNATDLHQNRSHLPGSGSWDYIANIKYLGQYKKFGIDVNSNFLLTTENHDAYKFGNKINLNGTLTYNIPLKKSSFYPNAGLFYEFASLDKLETNEIENSGGDILYYHAGVDFYYKSFSINSAIQIPGYQKLNGVQPETKSKFILGIAYLIN